MEKSNSRGVSRNNEKTASPTKDHSQKSRSQNNIHEHRHHPAQQELSRQHIQRKVDRNASLIDHTYRDYSQISADEVGNNDDSEAAGDSNNDDGCSAGAKPAQKYVKRQGRAKNFPAKLHEILSNREYRAIICWQPHGRSFKIKDKELLASVVCKKHFSHSKFESFNRQINGWGFKVGSVIIFFRASSACANFRQTSVIPLIPFYFSLLHNIGGLGLKRLFQEGPDKKTYYHECFLRGRPDLTKLMNKLGNAGKRLPDVEGEPDFYKINEDFPLPPVPSDEDNGHGTMDTIGSTKRPFEQKKNISFPHHPKASKAPPFHNHRQFMWTPFESYKYPVPSQYPSSPQGQRPPYAYQHPHYWSRPSYMPDHPSLPRLHPYRYPPPSEHHLHRRQFSQLPAEWEPPRPHYLHSAYKESSHRPSHIYFDSVHKQNPRESRMNEEVKAYSYSRDHKSQKFKRNPPRPLNLNTPEYKPHYSQYPDPNPYAKHLARHHSASSAHDNDPRNPMRTTSFSYDHIYTETYKPWNMPPPSSAYYLHSHSSYHHHSNSPNPDTRSSATSSKVTSEKTRMYSDSDADERKPPVLPAHSFDANYRNEHINETLSRPSPWVEMKEVGPLRVDSFAYERSKGFGRDISFIEGMSVPSFDESQWEPGKKQGNSEITCHNDEVNEENATQVFDDQSMLLHDFAKEFSKGASPTESNGIPSNL